MNHVCIQLYVQRANPGRDCYHVWMDFAVWYQSRVDRSITTIQALYQYFIDRRELRHPQDHTLPMFEVRTLRMWFQFFKVFFAVKHGIMSLKDTMPMIVERFDQWDNEDLGQRDLNTLLECLSLD